MGHSDKLNQENTKWNKYTIIPIPSIHQMIASIPSNSNTSDNTQQFPTSIPTNIYKWIAGLVVICMIMAVVFVIASSSSIDINIKSNSFTSRNPLVLSTLTTSSISSTETTPADTYTYVSDGVSGTIELQQNQMTQLLIPQTSI